MRITLFQARFNAYWLACTILVGYENISDNCPSWKTIYHTQIDNSFFNSFFLMVCTAVYSGNHD